MTPQNAASHLGIFCLYGEISSKNEIKIKITPNTPKNESGLIQLMMMGESIRQIWVKEVESEGAKVVPLFIRLKTYFPVY